MEKIAVHSGHFHADDVFAVAILRLIYPKIKVIRTRDENKLKKVDARIDVGFKYDPKTNDFDHHQKEGAGKRANGIPYASAGLIWKHFGTKLVSEEVLNYIDERVIQFIDAADNGVSTYTFEEVKPYTISDFVSDLNPQWPNQTDKLFDKHFNEAVSIVVRLLKIEIEGVDNSIKAKEKIRNEIRKSNGKYLVLSEYMPWKKVVIEESNLKFVIFHDKLEDQWRVCAVPVSLNTFENRKNLPREWGGLAGADLQRVTKVKDAQFCHKNLFIAVVSSKKGAIELVELALK